MLVFEHADKLYALLQKLARRPGSGEQPEEIPGRDGTPVLRLVGADHSDLLKDVQDCLDKARPTRIPHKIIDVPAKWAEVESERADLFAAADGWARAELYRRVLVELAAEFSSARNQRELRVRFRRFGLVNWLLESSHSGEPLSEPHDRALLRRLRLREFQRRPAFGLLRQPDTEVSLQEKAPWWAVLLGFHVIPVLWFRAWRMVGAEYRWLLRQPYLAPRDPGTFIGFALRLAQPRYERENPDQIGKLLVNAFLEDLRLAYQRRIWRRRAWRRTAYCFALLDGVSRADQGTALLSTLIEVRNETGVFAPLVIVAGANTVEDLLGERPGTRPGARAEAELAEGEEPLTAQEWHGQQPARLADEPYEAWLDRFDSAGRSREAKDWYLTVGLPPRLAEEDDRHPRWHASLLKARKFTVAAPRWWATRTTSAVAVFLALGLVAGLLVRWQVADNRWEARHCGLSRSHPDAATLRQQSTGECTGIAPHGFAFRSEDPELKDTLATIARQNSEATRIHREDTRRPVVTLVHISALFGGSGTSYGREALQGVASAQRRQLDRSGSGDPVLRIYPASAGAGMRYGPDVVDTVRRMMREDSSIMGVTGLDQSRSDTLRTIRGLTRVGLPMVATTLSADRLQEQSPLYYQVSPQNRREAAVAAAYARSLAEDDRITRTVRIISSEDRTDEYSRNLREDARRSFEAAGFSVGTRSFAPPKGTGSGAVQLGQEACDFRGLLFFAGRSEDFSSLLSGIDENCGSGPPRLMGGDDVARFAADPKQRTRFTRVPFDFLDFTLGSASCEGASNLYGTMKKLFPEQCDPDTVRDSSLDGHAALAFDAVNLYLKAIGRLRDNASGIPLSAAALWHGLSSIYGKEALDGESGRIDFGGRVDRQIPVDKLISVQRVTNGRSAEQVGFCGQVGRKAEATWCPAPEGG
ncbi:hypothetical protein SLNWT_5642 [Streptomyces albus]|uniref:Uncharacterized protein n=1 Tax=Streptomyces albus (strain ATCC 21838 / DSM 41398 / FERM P-419 / JCM 4703 / NBRC 107858) TaxID=1081613 RepID=A0A0B5ET64_STRA4|nr:hypothetical protein SLNWT_5642 [Streptomyces albus]AOU80320.1 hypothetical protein SLNHY_5629 [Streptomyces albus]AYN36031.1 hypothetical protein DUI70_5536 [Streptomyces albus]